MEKLKFIGIRLLTKRGERKKNILSFALNGKKKYEGVGENMRIKECCKHQKYIMCVILFLALCFSVGCGGNTETSSPKAGESEGKKVQNETTETSNKKAKEALDNILQDGVLATEEVQEAYTYVMQLKENKDVKADVYLEKMQYAMYQEDVYDIESEYTFAYDVESVGYVYSEFQGKWCVVDTTAGIEITSSAIDDKEYFIVSAYGGEMIYIVFGFFDEPEVWYEASLYTEHYGFSGKDGTYNVGNISYIQFFKDAWSKSFDALLYRDDEDSRIWLQAGNEMDYGTEQSDPTQQFSKEDVYAKAKEDFVEIYEDKYSMVDRLYMTVKYENVSEAKFSYDAGMDEYNIRFKITIFELGKIFDETYVLRATYTTNSYGNLEVVSFNLE